MTTNGNGGGSGPLTPPRSGVLIDMQRTSLRKFFSDLQRAGIDARPLIRELSTLSGESSEGLALLAMSYGTLSQPLNQHSPKKLENAIFQMKLATENVAIMDSTLRGLLDFVQPLAARKS